MNFLQRKKKQINNKKGNYRCIFSEGSKSTNVSNVLESKNDFDIDIHYKIYDIIKTGKVYHKITEVFPFK